MSLSLSDWIKHLHHQAKWTRGIRNHLYRRCGLLGRKKILEVGCGTGEITIELRERTNGELFSLDIKDDMLSIASRNLQKYEDDINWIQGNILQLPFENESFDLIIIGFVLMWLDSALDGIKELVRVLAPEGILLLYGEPDYTAQIIYPPNDELNSLLIKTLKTEGAQADIGRKLKALLVQAGLKAEIDLLAQLRSDEQLRNEFEAEWELIFKTSSDLYNIKQLEKMRDKDYENLKKGIKINCVPIFYGLGKK